MLPLGELRPPETPAEALTYWLRDESHGGTIAPHRWVAVVSALLSDTRPNLDHMTHRWEAPPEARVWLGRILRRAVVAAGGTRRELEYLRLVLAAAWADFDIPVEICRPDPIAGPCEHGTTSDHYVDTFDDFDDLDDLDRFDVGAVCDAIQDLLKTEVPGNWDRLVGLLVGTLDGASVEPGHPVVDLRRLWHSLVVVLVAAVLANSGYPSSYPPPTRYPGNGLDDPAISAAVVPTGPPVTGRTTSHRVLSVAA